MLLDLLVLIFGFPVSDVVSFLSKDAEWSQGRIFLLCSDFHPLGILGLVYSHVDGVLFSL